MKTKPKKPRVHPLAEVLFDVGMATWREVDPRRSPMKFSEIESPAQIAAWNSIAIFVETYAEKLARDPIK